MCLWPGEVDEFIMSLLQSKVWSGFCELPRRRLSTVTSFLCGLISYWRMKVVDGVMSEGRKTTSTSTSTSKDATLYQRSESGKDGALKTWIFSGLSLFSTLFLIVLTSLTLRIWTTVYKVWCFSLNWQHSRHRHNSAQACSNIHSEGSGTMPHPSQDCKLKSTVLRSISPDLHATHNLMWGNQKQNSWLYWSCWINVTEWN